MTSKFSLILFSLYATLSFSQENTFDILSSSPDYEIFTELLEITDVDELLKGDNYYSVFAPDDMTFEMVLSPEELDSLKLDETGTLMDLVLHHIVPDTVVIGFGATYLPLSGNSIFLFIDGAGNVLVTTRGATNPGPQLQYPAFSSNAYQETENGRILWMTKNYITPMCVSWQEVAELGSGIFYLAIEATELEDTIDQNEIYRTFILPSENNTYQYIQDNGGFNKTPFLDSFVRRHVMEGLYPFQDMYDGLTTKNLLGETYLFNVVDNERYFNNVLIGEFADGKNAVGLYMDSILLETEYSGVVEEVLDGFKVFPNPAIDKMTVHLPEGIQEAVASVFDMRGQLIHRQVLEQVISTMDIGFLEPGIYMVQCEGEHYRSALKFVKKK